MTPEAPEQQELFFEAVYADPEMADEDKVRWLHASAMEYWQRLEWAERRYAARDAEASAWAEQATRNADALTAARRDAAACEAQVTQLWVALNYFVWTKRESDTFVDAPAHMHVHREVTVGMMRAAVDALNGVPPPAPLPAEKGTDGCSG